MGLTTNSRRFFKTSRRFLNLQVLFRARVCVCPLTARGRRRNNVHRICMCRLDKSASRPRFFWGQDWSQTDPFWEPWAAIWSAQGSQNLSIPFNTFHNLSKPSESFQKRLQPFKTVQHVSKPLKSLRTSAALPEPPRTPQGPTPLRSSPPAARRNARRTTRR